MRKRSGTANDVDKYPCNRRVLCRKKINILLLLLLLLLLNDIDLQMTLNPWISLSGIQVCSSILWIMKFYSFRLELNPMILVLRIDLDIVKIYVDRSMYWKWSANVQWFTSYTLNRYTDTQTDLTAIIPNPHTRMGIRISNVSSAHLISPSSYFPGKVTGDMGPILGLWSKNVVIFPTGKV